MGAWKPPRAALSRLRVGVVAYAVLPGGRAPGLEQVDLVLLDVLDQGLHLQSPS